MLTIISKLLKWFVFQVLSEHYLEHRDACVDITLPHVLPEALHCILNFLYCGSASIPPGIRESVQEAANLLQIKDFTVYYPSTMKLEGQENITPEENLIKPQFNTTETPHQGKRRKRNRSSNDLNADSQSSEAVVQVKEECVAEQGIDGVGAGRRRRKIKSRYSADIYEVNLPKMRKWKRRKLQTFLKSEKETAVECQAETQQLSNVFQEPEKHTVPSLTTTVINTDEKSDENELLLKTGDIIKNSLSLPPPPPPTDSSSFTEKVNKSLTPQLPLTLASTSSSSVILPPIFIPDQSYLPDSTTKSEASVKISCPSPIVPEDSVIISERVLEPPAIAIGSPPPPFLLSEVKELPLMSPTSSLESFPLKQVTSLTHHHKILEPLHEDKNEEEEQEDGLLKFQV